MTEEELLFERASGITEPTEFFINHLNTVTDGLWAPALSVITFSVVFLGLNSDTRKSFAAASFAAMIVTVMLIPFGVMGSEALLLVGLMIVVAIAINNDNRGAV